MTNQFFKKTDDSYKNDIEYIKLEKKILSFRDCMFKYYKNSNITIDSLVSDLEILNKEIRKPNNEIINQLQTIPNSIKKFIININQTEELTERINSELKKIIQDELNLSSVKKVM